MKSIFIENAHHYKIECLIEAIYVDSAFKIEFSVNTNKIHILDSIKTYLGFNIYTNKIYSIEFSYTIISIFFRFYEIFNNFKVVDKNYNIIGEKINNNFIIYNDIEFNKIANEYINDRQWEFTIKKSKYNIFTDKEDLEEYLYFNSNLSSQLITKSIFNIMNKFYNNNLNCNIYIERIDDNCLTFQNRSEIIVLNNILNYYKIRSNTENTITYNNNLNSLMIDIISKFNNIIWGFKITYEETVIFEKYDFENTWIINCSELYDDILKLK